MILLFRTPRGFQEAEHNPINHSSLPTSTPDQTARVWFVWKSGRDLEMCKSGGDLTRAKMLASPLSPGETPLTFGPGLPHLEGERRGRWGKVWPVCTRPTSIQISECENEVSSLLLALRKNFTPALRPVPSCYGRI